LQFNIDDGLTLAMGQTTRQSNHLVATTSSIVSICDGISEEMLVLVSDYASVVD
jgi:hypothetical protein